MILYTNFIYMRYLQSSKGYYYKEYVNGNKIRIPRQTFEKNMKGGNKNYLKKTMMGGTPR